MSLLKIFKKKPNGNIIKKNIRHITNGAINLPKNIPNLNHKILGTKKILGLNIETKAKLIEIKKDIIQKFLSIKSKYKENNKKINEKVIPKFFSVPRFTLKYSLLSDTICYI